MDKDIKDKEESHSAKASRDEVADLKKELEEAKAKYEEYLNGWKRERADFINYKKSEVEKMGELVKYANEDIILKIIPILDNIYLAEAHIPEELKNHQWIKGFNHIKTQLKDFLLKEGIKPIETDGKFDPTLMEAVDEVERPEGCLVSGVVVEEVQRGYTMNGRIIRVAKVKISK
jgi:molecular chaperone GrpE